MDKQIQTARSELSDMRRSLGILELRDGNGVRTEGFTSAETFRSWERERNEVEGNYNRFNTVYSQVVTNAPVTIPLTLVHLFPDPGLQKLLEQQSSAQQDLAKVKQDYADGHPDVVRVRAILNKIEEQISAKVKGMMSGLGIQISGYRTQMDLLTKRIEIAKEEQNEWVRRTQPYFEKTMGS